MSPSMVSHVKTLTGVASDKRGYPGEGLSRSNFRKSRVASPATGWEDVDEDSSDPDLWLYRDRCVGLLKRYVRLAVEIGRLPSLLGREFFRGRVTSYTVSTFEETVIFVYDVEHSLEKLDRFDQILIAKIVLEEYSQREAAKILNCPLRTVERYFPEALDHLSEILLAGGILTPLYGATKPEKCCQGGERSEKGANCCKEGE